MIYVTDRETGKVLAYHDDIQQTQVLQSPSYAGCAVLQSTTRLAIGSSFPFETTVLREATSPALAAVIDASAT